MKHLKKIGSLTDLNTDERWAPHEFRNRVSKQIVSFKQLGVRPGDRVVASHGNSLEFFRDLFALWELGACVTPVHPSSTEVERNEIIAVTNASFHVDKNECRVFTTSHPINTSESDALALFTSGTTGFPKGILHSHSSLKNRIEQIQFQLSPSLNNGKTLCFLPVSFGHGLIGNCLAPFLLGGDLLLLSDFNPSVAGDLAFILRDEEIEFFSTVPSTWQILKKLSHPLSLPKLKRVHCASATLGNSTREWMREWCGSQAQLFNVYGLSEVGSWIAGSPHQSEAPEGFVGQFWGATAAILFEDNIVNVPHVSGEILIKTPSLMRGYLGNDSPRFSSGYFCTGDLGMFDENGNLILQGRLKDEIVKGGQKISPQEIIRRLEEHPTVQEAFVFGYKDEVWGQDIAAMVVPEDINKFDLVELQRWMLTVAQPLKRISKWKVVTALPKTQNGKPNRKAIIDAFALESHVSQRPAAINCE